jgi:hypothetical protein
MGTKAENNDFTSIVIHAKHFEEARFERKMLLFRKISARLLCGYKMTTCVNFQTRLTGFTDSQSAKDIVKIIVVRESEY